MRSAGVAFLDVSARLRLPVVSWAMAGTSWPTPPALSSRHPNRRAPVHSRPPVRRAHATDGLVTHILADGMEDQKEAQQEGDPGRLSTKGAPHRRPAQFGLGPPAHSAQ